MPRCRISASSHSRFCDSPKAMTMRLASAASWAKRSFHRASGAYSRIAPSGGSVDVSRATRFKRAHSLDGPENLLASRREGPMAKLNINGRVRDVQVEADTPLLWVIREQAGLTGTKYGCGVAQCGACSVHINGAVMRSCSIPVGSVKATDKIVTIEGLSATSSHPVQKAWAALDVPQCGYCQSGQIMAAAALLKKNPKPSDADIDDAMSNICRCGTYQRIRAAVHVAAGGRA